MAKTFFTRTVFAAASATLVATGLSATANAQSRELPTALAVYDGRDLTGGSGQATFNDRIKNVTLTADQIDQTVDVGDVKDHRNCRTKTSMSAAGKLESTAMRVRN